jgi:hypothetical protein
MVYFLVALVEIGNITLRLKQLGKVPQSVLWAAIDKLRGKGNTKAQKAFFVEWH